ncbi:MAG: type II toxin-antitoxin system VapC family toxin [Dehalococcoidaceae bacterium]|nr:type II toxin-antitoxin system VapC family toxin [Dehalococcoidaceae bacterium]
MSKTVVDASALLALLNGESGSGIVAEALPGGLISSVNLSEVAAKLFELGMPEKVVHRLLQSLGLDVVSFDEDQAFRAGSLRALTRDAGISLGDRACLSLARDLGLAVITADKAWRGLLPDVTVKLIR